MSKIIIFEGPNRVGKTTQINKLINNFKNLIFHKIHYFNLPIENINDYKEYSYNLYCEMFKMMKHFIDLNINIIYDRSHIGEAVYSPIYRNYCGKYVYDIEKQYFTKNPKMLDNIFLITLIDDYNTLVEREDGTSLYITSDELLAEIDNFKAAHNKSQIKNKILIDVNNKSIDELSDLIYDFLIKNQTNNEFEKNKQLSLNL